MNTIFFNTNLKYLREKQEMEQSELANLLNFKSSSTISEWEKGVRVPPVGILSDLARLFNVTLTDLVEKDLTDTTNLTKETNKNLTIAAHLEGEELTEDEEKQLLKYAEFLISQRK